MKMNIARKMYIVFLLIAVLLSDVMCAVIAYNYCDMLWGIKYAGYSAPANIVFYTAIPFIVAIIAAIISAIRCKKEADKIDTELAQKQQEKLDD